MGDAATNDPVVGKSPAARAQPAPAGAPCAADINPGLNPGLAGSGPMDLTDVNGTLFFTADDGFHGRELWKLRADD